MDPARLKLVVIVLIAAISGGTLFWVTRSGDDNESTHWELQKFQDEIQVIPITDARYGGGGVENLEDQIERKLNPDERRVFEHLADGQWRRFEDEFVAFEIPDDPNLNITVKKPGQASDLRAVGGAVGSTDNRFNRAYQITVGNNKLPYGILLMSKADWLDEGICFCGPIDHKRLAVRDGSLVEFSLLPSGNVKKMQALSPDGIRAILFEWTHSVIPQEVYARIADSIRLKAETHWSEEKWIEHSKEFRSGIELCGWIGPGDTRKKIEMLLGPPASATSGMLVYSTEEQSPWGECAELLLQVPLKNGAFHRFGENWQSRKELPPIKGSIRWVFSKLDSDTINFDGDESTTKIEPAAAEEIVEAFLTNAPKSQPEDLDSWCRAIHELHEKGFKDDRVLPIVRSFFEDTNARTHYAEWVLHDYKDPQRHEIFAAHIRAILGDSEQADLGFGSSDVGNLFSFLDKKHPDYHELLQLALNHENTDFQADGVRYAHHLPKGEAREVARRMSANEDDHVRSMTESLFRRVGTSQDVKVLKAWRERETEEDLKEEIEALIKKLGH